MNLTTSIRSLYTSSRVIELQTRVALKGIARKSFALSEKSRLDENRNLTVIDSTEVMEMKHWIRESSETFRLFVTTEPDQRMKF
ncbi:unnamed protein product [Lasius platythorax]|uniref:Uncharacterized protein n=1 Tax=Lasius platythorax TaxID=488582 RepID=A0AAV2PCT9_9HYME